MNNVTVKRNNIRIAPRKVREVVDLIRNKDVNSALDILSFTPKKSAIEVSKAVKSAISAARDKNMNEESLVINEVFVGQGSAMKRRWLLSRGQASLMKKYFCHLTLSVNEKEPTSKQSKIESKKDNKGGK